MTYVTFKLPDGYAEFEVEHYQPASPFRWNEPPEGGEITLADEGTWTPVDDGDGPQSSTQITLDHLVLMYMLLYGVDEPAARARVEDEAFEDVSQQQAESFDDYE